MTLAPRRRPAAHRRRSGDLRLRHRQRRVGQDQDPDRPGGAPAAGRASIRKRCSASPTPRPPPRRCSAGCSSRLGDWSVMGDDALTRARWPSSKAPGGFDAGGCREARALFARALETPGGLKIQTIHAFCEKLLRRFPLEAGVSPGFRVMDDAAAAAIADAARKAVARHALDRRGPVAEAYARFSVALDFASLPGDVPGLRGPPRGAGGLLRRAGRTGGRGGLGLGRLRRRARQGPRRPGGRGHGRAGPRACGARPPRR